MTGIRAFGIATAIALLLGCASSASAQSDWPNRAIRIVVPYPAGGIVDIIARAVTEQVGRDLKQTIVVADHEKLTAVVRASGMTAQ
ncbi:MAG: hypothetical protein JWR80_2029 [Bradyrhizobium sp.]|nr:hypothetical protein [Bradyrhizobium sp.]